MGQCSPSIPGFKDSPKTKTRTPGRFRSSSNLYPEIMGHRAGLNLSRGPVGFKGAGVAKSTVPFSHFINTFYKNHSPTPPLRKRAICNDLECKTKKVLGNDFKRPNGCWAACGPFIRAGVAGFLFLS
jgi:hypothetical protein